MSFMLNFSRSSMVIFEMALTKIAGNPLLTLFNAKTLFLDCVGKEFSGLDWRTSVKRGGAREGGTPLADKIHEIVFDSIANQQQAKPKPYYVQFQTTKMLQEITFIELKG